MSSLLAVLCAPRVKLSLRLEVLTVYRRPECGIVKTGTHPNQCTGRSNHLSKPASSLLIFLLCFAMLLAGCTQSPAGESAVPPAEPAGGATGQESPTPAEDAAAVEPAQATVYPIQTDVELTRFFALPAGPMLAINPDPSQWPYMQKKSKLTGVREKLIIPAANQAKEQINMMFASGDYTDIIEWNFLTDYPGGPEKAIQDGNILPLNDLIDQYAPNLKKYLAEHPEVDKQIKTDSGIYYGFPYIIGDSSLKTAAGPMLRKDWLDDLGLAVPETIDEWHTVLTAFKEQKGVAAPLVYGNVPRFLQELSIGGAFIGAFGINLDFFMEDGIVKYGPNEPGFKDFLTTFRKWYEEGLIDPDIAAVDNAVVRANMMSGKSGATYLWVGSGMGLFLDTMQPQDPKYDMVGTTYPVLNKGDRPGFGHMEFDAPRGGNYAISAKSKHPELAVQLLDWGYSEEGRMFYNFGVEGVTYDMVDGYPTYTELAKQDLTLARQGYYFNVNGPTVYDPRHYEQYTTYPQQLDAVAKWKETDMAIHKLPPLSPTAEESAEFSRIMNEVNTLVDEMSTKFVLGAESLDNYDQFQQKLKSLNIDRAIELQQAALERYLQR